MSDPNASESAYIVFDVFRYVRASQAQYGLKHADYKRYRCDHGRLREITAGVVVRQLEFGVAAAVTLLRSRCCGHAAAVTLPFQARTWMQAALQKPAEQATRAPQVPSWAQQVSEKGAEGGDG
jgi:hypothetical protein